MNSIYNFINKKQNYNYNFVFIYVESPCLNLFQTHLIKNRRKKMRQDEENIIEDIVL